MDETAEDSLAATRARSKFGIAIAAIMRMIATTISNSISEKPFCLRIKFVLSLGNGLTCVPPGNSLFEWHSRYHFFLGTRALLSTLTDLYSYIYSYWHLWAKEART